jgi:hypothetical protein
MGSSPTPHRQEVRNETQRLSRRGLHRAGHRAASACHVANQSRLLALIFFVGLHQPSDAKHFERCFVSVTRLSGQHGRRSCFTAGEWIMDSGAFTTIERHGGYPEPPSAYAAHIRRWRDCGRLLAASSQDYMCEPHMLERTGLSVADHQRLTIERYDALVAEQTGVYILPVIQGYEPREYVSHVRQYGARLAPDAWVGVGSVCKRNGSPRAIESVLYAIKRERPDLRLHGFGLKGMAFGSSLVTRLLYSADSMAWSYAARRQGKNANDWREARRWIGGDGLFAERAAQSGERKP